MKRHSGSRCRVGRSVLLLLLLLLRARVSAPSLMLWTAWSALWTAFVAWALLRLACRLFARVRAGHLQLRALGGNDSAWLLELPGNTMFINAVFVTDDIDIDELRALLGERGAAHFPRLRERIVYVEGTPYWEPVEVDLSKHIFEVREGRAVDEAELRRLLEAMWAEPLDPTRPMWQFQLVRSFAGRGSAVVFRVHHAYADGVSLVAFLLSIMDEPPAQQGAEQQMQAQARRGVGGAPKSRAQAVGYKAPSPLSAALPALSFPASLLHKFVRPADANALHGPALSGRRVVAWSPRFELSAVKRAKNALGVSVNDLLMAALTGALRDVCVALEQKRGAAHAERAVEDMAVNIPISLRRALEPGVLDNQFSLLSLKLPTSEADSAARLRKIKLVMDAAKKSVEPLGNYLFISRVLGALPPALSSFVLNFVGSKTTATLTNVPGPQEIVHIGGRRVQDIMFWVPSLANIGVGLSIISYADGVRVGVSCDSAIGAHADAIIAAFLAQLEALCKQRE